MACGGGGGEEKVGDTRIAEIIAIAVNCEQKWRRDLKGREREERKEGNEQEKKEKEKK